jgi:hypothetical protein
MKDATVPKSRRDELIEHALVLAIEVLNRLSPLCSEGDLDDDISALKELLEEHDLEPETIARLQWGMRDVLDLIGGKDPAAD